MIHLCCFSDSRMTISQQKLVASAKRFGIESCHVWRETDLPDWFIDNNKEVFANEFGYGFYIWKSFIIWQTMKKLNQGDILLYCDSGITLVDSVQPVIDSMSNNDIFLMGNGWPMRDWTKMDILHTIYPMVDWYADKAALFQQVQASCMLFRVSDFSKAFVKQWLLYCQFPGFCDNSPSHIPNVPTFRENRWDQAVLGVLQLSWGIQLHWYACTTGYHLQQHYPKDRYRVFMDHHRRRNEEWK